MGSIVLKGCRLLIGGADVSGKANRAELEMSTEAQEVTNFDCDGWREQLAGVSRASLNYTVNEDLSDWSSLDGSIGMQAPISLIPAGSLPGSAVYFLEGLPLNAVRKLEAGKAMVGEYSGSGTGAVFRGKLSAYGRRTSGGAGLALNMGAIPSGRSLCAVLHVLSISGGTLSAKVQSSVAGGFGSSTDRITFSSRTAPGAELLKLAGPVTDGYYRAAWTLDAGEAEFALIIGER